MAKFVLEILDGDRAGDCVSLGENALRIGRKPANDLVIADEKASGVHAEIVREGGRFVLRDLGSTNGTLMEGRRVAELVLSSGDTFSIGRVRLRFRDQDQQADAALTTGLEVGRLDTARLAGARSARPIGLLVVLLIVVLGAGGYYLWQQRDGYGDSRTAAAGPRAPLLVAGNQLPAGAGACESDSGWDLRAAGSGFVLGGLANTGDGCLLAERLPPSGEVAGSDGKADQRGFAVAVSDEIEVLAGRQLLLAAHLMTQGSARVAVRLHFFRAGDADSGGHSFHFRSGTALAEYGDWTRAAVELAVPSGTDRCQVELVAQLPSDGSSAVVDDVALTEVGTAAGVQQRVGESAVMLLGTGQSFALRSSLDQQRPVALYGLVPAAPPADLRGLYAAGLLTLSDVGASVRHQVDESRCTIAVDGWPALQLQFPADSTNGLLVETDRDGEREFASAGAAQAFTTRAVLLGDRMTRCMVELDEASGLQGSVGGGLYHLLLPGAGCRIVVGFRTERQQAGALLRSAQEHRAAGRPGQALDAIAELAHRVPHDVETLTRALSLRGKISEELAEELREIGQDLEEAQFFDTRGGFRRVVQRLDELCSSYGEANLADPRAVAALRQQAAEQLAALDGRRDDKVRARLEVMAAAFETEQRQGLAVLVRDYIGRYLPKPPDSNEPGESDREGEVK